jgi:Tfp pilus assembly protein PilW
MRQRVEKSRAASPGMTLVEMCIGLVVTSLIIGALSALWFAVAETWTRSSSSQHVSLTGGQAVARLETILRQSKYIFQWKAGSTAGNAASALIWKGDNWNGVADAAVQIGELALVEHDANAKRIYLYQAIPATAMDASMKTRAGGVATWSDLSNTATVTAFKGYDFVQRTVITEAVTDASFNVPTATAGARQILEFNLTVSRDEGNALVYSAAALRGPTTKPL